MPSVVDRCVYYNKRDIEMHVQYRYSKNEMNGYNPCAKYKNDIRNCFTSVYKINCITKQNTSKHERVDVISNIAYLSRLGVIK